MIIIFIITTIIYFVYGFYVLIKYTEMEENWTIEEGIPQPNYIPANTHIAMATYMYGIVIVYQFIW